MKRSRLARIILLSFAAVAGLVLGLDRTGLTPIVPGYDVRFAWGSRQAAGGSELILTSDAGDLSTWLALRVRVTGQDAGRAQAALSNGQSLTVLPTRLGQDVWSLELSDGKGTGRGVKFDWPSGIEIIVLFPGTSLPGVRLENWEVYLKDKESDSLLRSGRRKRWGWISLGLLMLAAIGAVVGVWPQRDEPQPFTSETCIRQVIADVEGRTEEETQQMRSLLRKVLLEGAESREAVEALGLPFSESLQVWFAARRNLIARLKSLIGSLSNLESRL